MDELLRLLAFRAYREGDFLLASGARSTYFIDCKAALLSGRGHVLVGENLLHALRNHHPDVDLVAGVALGGCNLASALATLAELSGDSVDALFVRKGTKDHGSKQLIEGLQKNHPGKEIVILEDTVTTGISSLRAARCLIDAGLKVKGVLAVVDRQQNHEGKTAKTLLASEGIAFHSLFGVDEIKKVAHAH